MRRSGTRSLVCLACCALLFSACASSGDILKIRTLSLSPTCPTTRTEIVFTAVVENAGPRSSATSTLAFTVGAETAPQLYRIPSLATGATFTVKRKAVLNAGKYQTEVKVDLNKTVQGSGNGSIRAAQAYFVTQSPDTSRLRTFTYNEANPTILRGVLIDETAAKVLNVRPGYYRIGEYGVANQAGDKAKVLDLEKNYTGASAGQGALPVRSEPWVFSLIKKDGWISVRRQAFAGWDYYGHSFKYELEWIPASDCWQVITAVIDCAKVGLSTSAFISGDLNTCDWRSEPAWTNP